MQSHEEVVAEQGVVDERLDHTAREARVAHIAEPPETKALSMAQTTALRCNNAPTAPVSVHTTATGMNGDV